MGWKSLKCGLHFKGISSDCKGRSSVMTNGFPLVRNTNYVLVLNEANGDHHVGGHEDEEGGGNVGRGGLRKMVRDMREELEKERQAAASAAEEAMAMILRLQNEKSMILMESKQCRLMAEKKQVHDREVIRSLKWIVKKHEMTRKAMENQLRFLRKKSRVCVEGNGNEEGVEGEEYLGKVLDGEEEEFEDKEDEDEDGDAPLNPSYKGRNGELLLSSLDLGP